ncbi:putative pentatricopeptide [Rosa chinensis]|uniref:Putative pentatricopeptide n=1 Tax=Rosa chinensis TaxID=74649 RepID=A0A2P6PED1_ROSCH|nr:putative pentatricopeptide [Rosa chinensis]
MFAGRNGRSKQVFDLMISKGSMVDVNSCSILINGSCKAKKIFKEMRCMELVPNTITYNTLIDGLCKVERIQEAEKLFSEMQGCSPLPDVQTYMLFYLMACVTISNFLRQ